MKGNQGRMKTSAEESEFTNILAQAASKSPEKGLELLERELRRQPQNQRLYYYKGMFLVGLLHRYEEGLKTLEQALQMDSQDEASLYYKGQALRELKRYEEALQVYDQALEVEESNVTYYAKGKVLCHLQRYEEALQAVEESLDICEECEMPPDADVWNLKGRTLVGLRRAQEALEAYDEALRLDPQNKEAFKAKGEILRTLDPDIPPRKTPEENT